MDGLLLLQVLITSAFQRSHKSRALDRHYSVGTLSPNKAHTKARPASHRPKMQLALGSKCRNGFKAADWSRTSGPRLKK